MLGVFGPAFAFTSSAAAEPRLSADRSELRRQLVDLQRQTRELEAKMRRIEAELARDASSRAAAPRALSSRLSAAADCRIPTYFDGDGIKHVRLECVELASQSSCDPPYGLDERGVRRFRPDCAAGDAAPGNRADE